MKKGKRSLPDLLKNQKQRRFRDNEIVMIVPLRPENLEWVMNNRRRSWDATLMAENRVRRGDPLRPTNIAFYVTRSPGQVGFLGYIADMAEAKIKDYRRSNKQEIVDIGPLKLLKNRIEYELPGEQIRSRLYVPYKKLRTSKRLRDLR